MISSLIFSVIPEYFVTPAKAKKSPDLFSNDVSRVKEFAVKHFDMFNILREKILLRELWR